MNVKKLGAELKALAPAAPAKPLDAQPPQITVRKPSVKVQEAIPVQQPNDNNVGQSVIPTSNTGD